VHEAFVIDPFNISNLFVNYSLKGSSSLSQSRIRLAINNRRHSGIEEDPKIAHSGLG
jgi:hypothetical protein